MLRITLVFFLISTNVLATPNIVVSIKPIHSIVSNITQGVVTPKLLIKNNQSPHHFHLKPSQISLVSQADLVIAVHPNIEKGITKLLDNIDSQNKLYVVENLAKQDNKHEDEGYKDYHIWLNISAIQKFSTRLKNKLIAIDLDNRLIYQSNLSAFNKKLNVLKIHIKRQLLPYQNTPMITYSNVFENFIQTNQLNTLTTVINNHEQRASVKNILNARKIIRSKNVLCLISSTEITPKRVNTIIEDLNIRYKSIDIIGFNYTQGVSHYPVLMQNITNAFEKCLK